MSEIHAETTLYVRDTMLPPAPPPLREAGAIRWLRENLFAGPINSVMTMLALGVILWIVWHLAPWFLNSVWSANSLSECRQIIAATHGEGASGACFAVITERWNQFLFGFYPPELYWRPVLAFGLMFFALAPVLFSESPSLRRGVVGVATIMTALLTFLAGASGVGFVVILAVLAGLVVLSEKGPGRGLSFTLLFPFVAVWLLWGGSAWSIIMVILSLVAGVLVWRVAARLGMLAVALGVAATLLALASVAGPAADMLRSVMPLGLEPAESRSFGGFMLAITIGVAGITLSLPIGVILALARQSDMPVVKTFAVIFIEFCRGVPLITMLFVASMLLNYFLPPSVQFDIILRVIIMVTIFSSAYIAEVVRGGLAALPRGQYEAADALGLDYWKAQRLIILPQALKISIPGIVGTFIGLFKDTTLVTFVGLFEPLKQIPDAIRANFEWKGIYWEPFIFTGLIFFVLCFSMSRYSMYLERRLKRDHH